MTSKVIYFTVGGLPEQAEFSSDDTLDDVRGYLLACEVILWLNITHLTAALHYISLTSPY